MNKDKLALLREVPLTLAKEIRGQGHVIEPVCRILRRAELGLTDPRRPRGSFLFVGPTGVGKTELVLSMCRSLRLPEPYRIDMSEFMLQESVGELLERFVVMRETLGPARGMVLLDEIEKAHGLILDLLLQILDAGRVTAAGARHVSFLPYYVALTSNIGAAEAMRAKHTNDTMFQTQIIGMVRRRLRPEIFNRIQMKCAFRALEWDVQCEIARLLVDSVCFRLRGIGHDVRVDEAGVRRIIEFGIDREQGARPLRNVAEDLIEGAVADALLAGACSSGNLTARPTADDLVFKAAA